MTDNEFSREIKADTIDRKGFSKTIEANEAERNALIKRFDLHDLTSLSANIDISISNNVYHVTGMLRAHLYQTSVISGNPVAKEIEQTIDTYLTNDSKIVPFDALKDDEYEIRDEKDDPDKIIDGVIDMGEITTQFLGLALDDYPRGDNEDSGDYIEKKDSKDNPFAALKDINVKE